MTLFNIYAALERDYVLIMLRVYCLQEASERAEQVKTEENIAQQENHMVLKLCASLFPSNPNSLWRGPHSLARRPVAVRESPIHAAVATLMKQ